MDGGKLCKITFTNDNSKNQTTPKNRNVCFTALFNDMRTLQFKGQPTIAFFATVNQMFGGSSQLTTAAEVCFVVCTVLNDFINARSAVVGSWDERPKIRLILNFGVRMLLKSAVIQNVRTQQGAQRLLAERMEEYLFRKGNSAVSLRMSRCNRKSKFGFIYCP